MKIEKLPCEDCITLAVCRNYSVFRLTKKCKLLDEYLKWQQIHKEWAERYDKARNFLYKTEVKK